MSRQTILVLGAGGFIGRNLTDSLASSDWANPIAAGRSAGGDTSAAVRSLRLDASDEPALARAMESVDGVVNCVAGSAQGMIEVARALTRVAAGLRIAPRIVHLSSMAVYGSVSGLIDESAALAGMDPYARAKIVTEQLMSRCPSAVVLRPGIVYGPGGRQWTERIARWLYAHRMGDLGPAGDGYCNLLYVGDLVQAIMQALRLSDAGGQVFNAAMAQPPTWNDYFVRFGRALGAVPIARLGRRRLQIETRLWAPPLKIAEIAAGRLKLRGLELPEAIPPSFLRLCQQEIRLDVSAAEQTLRLGWTDLDAGLQRAAQWSREVLAQ
jgi:nucleoside-diphosphate-sugar epimerase